MPESPTGSASRTPLPAVVQLPAWSVVDRISCPVVHCALAVNQKSLLDRAGAPHPSFDGRTGRFSGQRGQQLVTWHATAATPVRSPCTPADPGPSAAAAPGQPTRWQRSLARSRPSQRPGQRGSMRGGRRRRITPSRVPCRPPRPTLNGRNRQPPTSTRKNRTTANSLDPSLKKSPRPTADCRQAPLAAGSIDEARQANADRTPARGHRFRSVAEPSRVKGCLLPPTPRGRLIAPGLTAHRPDGLRATPIKPAAVRASSVWVVCGACKVDYPATTRPWAQCR